MLPLMAMRMVPALLSSSVFRAQSTGSDASREEISENKIIISRMRASLMDAQKD